MKTVTKAQLKQWLDRHEDMLLIDVLPAENFRKQHVPGAVNIPFKDNTGFLGEVAQRVASEDERIVVYCRNAQCPLSKEAAKKLESEGYTNVCAFEEGVEGWFGKSSQAAA